MGGIVLLFLIILFVLAIKYLCSNSGNEHSQDIQQPSDRLEVIVQTLDLPDNEFSGTFETKIAGINKYCSFEDIGIFKGIIFNESINSYNKNAMVIFSMESKRMGYIPEEELQSYINWSKKKPFTCVGFVKSFQTADGVKLYGRVVSIQPCNSSFVERKEKEIYEDFQMNEFS